jgi:hypothetical protein
MLMWEKDGVVVDTTTTPDIIHEGQRIWHDRLERFGVVRVIGPHLVTVELEEV